MEEADIINNKESIFKKFKKLYMENGCIRMSAYNTFMLLCLALSIPVLFSTLIFIILMRIEYRAQMASYIDDLESKYSGFPKQKVGELDQKLIDLVKKVFKKITKKDNKNLVDEEIKTVDNREAIEELNNRLKELNPNGSIVRDPIEIAKEKAEYVGLLELLKQYQAIDNKDKSINNTPVPTLEINNDQEKSYSYMKK